MISKLPQWFTHVRLPGPHLDAILCTFSATRAFELPGKAPDPASTARQIQGQIAAALWKAHRRGIETKTDRIRGKQVGRAPVFTAAYAATVRSAVATLATLNAEIKTLQGQVDAHSGSS